MSIKEETIGQTNEITEEEYQVGVVHAKPEDDTISVLQFARVSTIMPYHQQIRYKRYAGGKPLLRYNVPRPIFKQ